MAAVQDFSAIRILVLMVMGTMMAADMAATVEVMAAVAVEEEATEI